MPRSLPKQMSASRSRTLRPLLLGLTLLSTAASTALGAGGDTNRFVALQLKVTASEVTLVQALEFPGKVKPEPKAKGLDYVILSEEGSVIGRGSTENPRFERACLEEQPGSGTLTRSSSTLEEGITVLRLPANPGAHSIEFFESQTPGVSQSSIRQSLGKVSLKTP